LCWDWGSFPEFLDALERQPRAIDVGAHLPHAALRAFVMGERGADPAEHPNDDELGAMARLLGEGLDAGAIGVSTSRTERHRTSTGDNLGTLRAREPELMTLASVLAERNTGVFQLLSDSYRTTDDEFARAEFALVAAFARASGRPVSYTVQQDIEAPERWRDLMALATSLREEGLDVKAQVAPRPIGVLLGLQASVNVFTPARAYARIADLPLAERLEALRDPERRRQIIEGHAARTSGPDAFAGMAFFARFDEMYVLDDPVDYDLDASRSLGATARRAGVDPRQYAYDIQLQRDGNQLIYTPMFNFVHGNLDDVHTMITDPVALFGLSDAGAHCGQICDGSMTTTYLSLWGRDRRDGDGIPVEQVVHQITQRPAAHFGWLDRGVVEPGRLADLNVIDLEGLECRPPEITADLPAGGRRLQAATCYRWTVKRGQVTFEDGEPTGALPGTLLRGTGPQPVGARG
jgi:N-acyl-D-aspartate/D-glutamate deacylase